MPSRSISCYPDPVLLSPAIEADLTRQGLETIVQDMIETMYWADGIGLAAPQVGIGLRIFVMDTQWHQSKRAEPKTFINPSYEPVGDAKRKEVEGCLSLPGANEKVERWERVRVSGYTVKGEWHEMEVEGLAAACVQHECDHLDGKLYISRLSQTKRQRAIKQFRIHEADPAPSKDGSEILEDDTAIRKGQRFD